MRAFLSGSFGSSLSRMLPELAQRSLYGDLEGKMTILKPWASTLVTVAAVGSTNWKWRQHSVWTTRSPIHSESIGTHRSVVTTIDAEDASALAMVCDPYLPASHP